MTHWTKEEWAEHHADARNDEEFLERRAAERAPPPVPQPPADVDAVDTGSFFLLQPRTPAGETWLAENVEDWHCEVRYVYDVLYGAFSTGLSVSVDGNKIEHMEPK